MLFIINKKQKGFEVLYKESYVYSKKYKLRRNMQVRVENTRLMSSDGLLSKLHKSAVLYSQYADTTLLFIFREKKTDRYEYYEVRFGRNNFMHLANVYFTKKE